MTTLNHFNSFHYWQISMKFSGYVRHIILHSFSQCVHVIFPTGFVPHTKRALVDESSAFVILASVSFTVPRRRDGVRGQVSNSAIDRIPAHPPHTTDAGWNANRYSTTDRWIPSRSSATRRILARKYSCGLGGVRARRPQSSSRHLGVRVN